MTKYICECLDGARKCTHETPGFSAPTLCCVRAHATCHWRKTENQEVIHPRRSCRSGAELERGCMSHRITESLSTARFMA